MTRPSTAVGSTSLKQDQPDTGAVPSGDRQLGCTMVLYPGHPLVGRSVSVVRRYGQREHGQWIIELPDGSRQYVPISWCAPLSSSEETPPVPASSQDEPSAEGATPSPLSLEVLRNLVALVRRLREEAAQRGEEQQDAGHTPGEDAQQDPATDGRGRPSGAERDAGVAAMGEFPAGGSAPAGAHHPPRSTPPGGGPTDEQPPEEVRES
jgi:hypothetical protein